MIEVNMNSMDGVVLMTAGKKIEENIKVTPVASLILPEYDGAYELLVPTVSGVWVFNEVIEFPSDVSFAVGINFISNGSSFNRISVSDWISNEVVYGSSIGEDVSFLVYIDDDYRTIDFGTTAQAVSEEFYAWFTANAVKQ